MKKIFKWIVWIIIFLIIITCTVLIYFYFTKSEQVTPLSQIPEDAVLVAETQNVTKTWDALVETEFWQKFVNSQYLEEFRSDIHNMDSLVRYNKMINLLLKNRDMAFSIHQINDDFDFLFVIDLNDGTRFAFITKLSKLLGYSVAKKIYNDRDLYELKDKETGDIIYLGIVNNLLIISLSDSIIKNALEIEDNFWKYNLKFQKVSSITSGRNLIRFYINYSQLASFYNIFFDDEQNNIESFTNSIYYSAFNLNIEENLLKFGGFTNINDSLNSYLRAISKTKPSSIRAHTIIPKSTAAYISINFEDFDQFYKNLMDEYHIENPKDLKTYEKRLKSFESMLEVSLDEVLFSWFGNEIMLLKMRPFPGYKKDEWMMLIHSNNTKIASEKLKYFMQKIDENSPLKLKSEVYKNYEIGNLNVSGFFNLLFGKLFDSIDKPYFTVIEDFVLFANSPEVIYRFIDNYLKGLTLYQRDNYQQVFHELNYKGNLTVYLNTPNFYQYLYSYSSSDSRAGLKDSKDLIMGFSDIGCQMTADKGMLNTIIAANYNENSSVAMEVERLEEAVEFSISTDYFENLLFIPQVLKENNPGTGKYHEYFPDSIIKLEGMFKDSLKTNIWRTYYDNKNVESMVNYKEGKPDGITYFYYNDDNQTVKVELTYDDGKLNGPYIEYYTNGTRKVVIHYEKGTPEGEAFYYYPNGSIKLEGKYKNGKKKGKWQAYTPKGERLN